MKAKRGTEEKYISPYMHSLLPETMSTRRSARFIINFIGKRELGKTLDIGCPNPLGSLLEKHYNIKLDNTDIDLDIGELIGEYDTIFCFEVVEHLFNPLNLLFQIKKVLKYEGRVYITTPKCKPYFLWSKVHFHEFHKRELIDLIERTKLKIVRFECRKVRPLWWYYTGLRPFLRLIFERRYFIELEK